jgi:hypothetical protein
MQIRAGQCNNNLQNKHNKNIQVTASKLGMIHSSTLNHSKMATHQERPRMLIERKQCEMNERSRRRQTNKGKQQGQTDSQSGTARHGMAEKVAQG